MKMPMSTFLTVLVLTSVTYAQATKDSIMDLASSIRSEVVISKTSQDNLNAAQKKLQEALNLIRNSSSSYSADCFNYAYSKYSLSYSTVTATEKSVLACKKINDVEVAKFLYDKYSLSYSSSTSIDRTAELFTLNLLGKADLIQYAYSKYSLSYSSSTSVDKSAAAINKVPAGSLDCVTALYSKYSLSYSSSTATDKSFAGCTN